MEVKSMGKRLLSVLLSFVLVLSLIPAAYAKPMTLVLEATGDTDQEFVYFIRTNAAYVDRTLKNVEVINEATYYSCTCGFTAIGYRSDEGVYEDTGWYQHWGRLDPSCGNYWYITWAGTNEFAFLSWRFCHYPAI